LAREIFIDISYNDPLQIPIREVLNVLSADKQGFIKYNDLGKVAEAGRLFDLQANGTINSTFANLRSAYAEAIVLQGFRQGGTLNTAKNTDKDVKAILRQSPACSVLTAKESETLVNSWVSTAQSAPDSTHSTSTAKNHQPGGFQR
jgi:hypothetical protein